MKAETLLIFGGVAFLTYWLLKKTPNAVSVDPPKQEEVKPEPKTIVLNLRDNTTQRRKQFRQDFLNPYIKDFNTSKHVTVAPASVTIEPMY